jgi:hypothetical protein
MGWDRNVTEIKTTIRIKAASKYEASRIYGEIEFDIGRGPDSTYVRALIPRYRKVSTTGEGNTTVWIEYTIRVPHSTDLLIRSVTGEIGVHQVGGSFDLRSERGSVVVVSRGGEGEIRSLSGDINCRIAFLEPGGSLYLKSSSGDVSLFLPADTSARVEATTRAGRVRARIAMTEFERRDLRGLLGTLGSGNGSILLRSSSGDVIIENP